MNTLKTKLRALLGDLTNIQYKDYELVKALELGIYKTHQDACRDAKNSLISEQTGAPLALSSTISAPDGEIISFQAQESDDNYRVWKATTYEDLIRVKGLEGDVAQDSTMTRLYALHTAGIMYFYPQVAIGRTYIITYIAQPTAGTTTNLPDNNPDLQQLAVYYAAAMMKISDPNDNIFSRYMSMYESGMRKVNSLYYNKYNLSPAESTLMQRNF